MEAADWLRERISCRLVSVPTATLQMSAHFHYFILHNHSMRHVWRWFHFLPFVLGTKASSWLLIIMSSMSAERMKILTGPRVWFVNMHVSWMGNYMLTVGVYVSANACLSPCGPTTGHLSRVSPCLHPKTAVGASSRPSANLTWGRSEYWKVMDKENKRIPLTWFCGSGGWLWASGAWPWPWLSLPPTGEPRVVAVMLATGQILAILAS